MRLQQKMEFGGSHCDVLAQIATDCDDAWLQFATGDNMVNRIILSCVLVASMVLGASAQKGEWKQLFNGKDLTGWKHVGPGEMVVENGVMRTKGGMGLLYWTGGKVGNSVIRVVWRLQGKEDNGGIFIRIPIEPKEEWMPVHYGYETQIHNEGDDYHVTGVLYSMTKAMARPGKPGPEWNTTEITLDGPRTIVTVNGVKVTDFKEGDPVPERKKDFEPHRGPRPNEGWFGLQNHGEKDAVFYKEVSIKPLKK